MNTTSACSKGRIYILTLAALVIIFLISRASFSNLYTGSPPTTSDSTNTTLVSISPSLSHQIHPEPIHSEAPPKHAPWLLYTSSSSHDFQRRLLIRWSWVNTFADPSIYDHVFAVTTTDPTLITLIKKENETYGDILLLDQIPDSLYIANHIKPFEVLKKLTSGGWKGRTYDFVSKVDQDSWVDPIRVWEKYLKGRKDRDGMGKGRVIVSMNHAEFCGCPAPQGGFYTVGWSLAKVISRIYDKVGIHDDYIDVEDCMVGRFPTDEGEKFDFVDMDEEETFDVEGDEGDYTARDWVQPDTKIRGPVGSVKKAVFLHQLKEDEKWLAVQELFDETGWTGNRTAEQHDVTMGFSEKELEN